MSTGFLFVTAPSADYKAVNALLHELQNWEYNDGESEFRLITTKNAYDFEPPAGTHVLDGTLPKLDSTFTNAWAGSSLKDVEEFCLDIVHNSSPSDDSPWLFVVVDSAGFEARTGIVVERATADADEDFKLLDSFVKMRVPWDEVQITWCNLSIANSDFDEMGERRETKANGDGGGEADVEDEGDGWYDYHTLGADLSDENANRKKKAFQRLKDDGLI